MRKIFEIARNELSVIFRVRGILLNLVVIPVAIAFAIGLANGGGGGGVGTSTLRVDVVDEDQSALSAQFLQGVRLANPDLVLCPLDNDDADVCGLEGQTFDAEQIDARLRSQTSLAYLEIPNDFEARLAAGEEVTVVYRSNEDAVSPGYILQAVQSAARRASGAAIAGSVGADAVHDFAGGEVAGAREAIAARALDEWRREPVTVEFVEGAEPEAEGSGGFQQSIPGIASMYVMFAVFPAISAFLEERKNWTFQRMMVMPVSRAQVLGGKLLARFALGLIQFAVLFGFGLLLGVRYGDNLPGLAITMIAYTLCVTALTLALMTLVRSEGQAAGLATFLTLTLAPLGGAWWPLEIVPEWMRAVGHISPVAWAMDAFHALIFFDGDLTSVAVPVLVLLGGAVVLFALGVARFQYE